MSPETQKAVLDMKSQTELGVYFNKTQQAISLWFKNQVPAEYVISMANILDWKVTPHEIRPDIYPNAFDGIPQSKVTKPQMGEVSRG